MVGWMSACIALAFGAGVEVGLDACILHISSAAWKAMLKNSNVGR